MDTITQLEELINIDSPSGYTHNATSYIMQVLKGYGYSPSLTVKGAVRCALGPDPTVALAAHTDTLGAIVSSIEGTGGLRFSPLGGPLLPSFESSYVRIHTMGGGTLHGTLLLSNPSTHANNKAGSAERSVDSMYIRLDEKVSTADDVRALGVRVGDIVAFEPKYRALPNGYIKSHFLDNKAGCYVLFEVARAYADAGVHPPVELFFSTYEEVGHGGAPSYTPSVNDVLVIDMGVVGDRLSGAEHLCSICAKDSGGPYDYTFRTSLVELAEHHRIPHAIDVYPYYSSDGTALWRAGGDVRVALIGPGVHASHGMERTHVDGIRATVDLCRAYIDRYHATS